LFLLMLRHLLCPRLKGRTEYWIRKEMCPIMML
jgi:hypothetical protein